MGSNKLTTFIDTLRIFEQKNRPTILTGLGVAGLWTTGWMIFKASPRAHEILAAKRKDMSDIQPGDKETKRTVVLETIKEMAPVIAPPILMGVASSACIIGANNVSTKRMAALSAAYSVTETALKDYKGKVTELLGAKKANTIREAITKDKLEKDPPTENTEVIITGNGDVLCKDLYSGRYFTSSAEKIGRAINELSHDLISEMWVSLNDFYYLIDLPRIPMGDDLGWSIEHSDRGNIPISFTAILTENERPCLCVSFDVEVRPEYR